MCGWVGEGGCICVMMEMRGSMLEKKKNIIRTALVGLAKCNAGDNHNGGSPLY